MFIKFIIRNGERTILLVIKIAFSFPIMNPLFATLVKMRKMSVGISKSLSCASMRPVFGKCWRFFLFRQECRSSFSGRNKVTGKEIGR